MVSSGTIVRLLASGLTIVVCLTVLDRNTLEAAGTTASGTCSVYCRIDQCADATHRALTPYSIDEVAHGYHSMCLEAYCGYESQSPSEHEECADSFLGAEDYASLEAALERKDATGIARLIATNASTLELNLDRSSIKVVGCNGRVTANLPLDASELLLVQQELKEY